jgi:rhamnogalacturonyl hydrolase YesR
MKNISLFVIIFLTIGLSGQLIAQRPSEKAIEKSMLKAYKWQQKNPNHVLNDWTNGAYYIGITKAYQSTGNKSYSKGCTPKLWKN